MNARRLRNRKATEPADLAPFNPSQGADRVPPGFSSASSSPLKAVAVALLVLTALCSTGPVWGQELVLAGRKIEAAEVQGLNKLVEESVLFYLKCEVGLTWDPGLVNSKIKDLWTREPDRRRSGAR